MATAGKVVKFDTAFQTNITGTVGATPGFTVAGTGCTTPSLIQSTLPGTRAPVNVTGASSIDMADIKDINAIAALTATNSINSGNNLNFTITACPTFNAIGNVMSDEIGTVPAICDSVTPVVTVTTITATSSVPCTTGTGAFTAPGLDLRSAGMVVTAWIDGVALVHGAQYLTTVGTGDITGLKLIYGHVLLRSDDATTFTSSRMNVWDYTNDNDIPINATATDLVDQFATELQVMAGTTFQDNGSVTLAALDVQGTFNAGSAYTTGTLTLTSYGTGGCSNGPGVQMPLCLGGVFTNSLRSTVFTGNGTTYVPDATNLGNPTIAPTVNSVVYQLCQASSYTTTTFQNLTIGDGVHTLTVRGHDCETLTLGGVTTAPCTCIITIFCHVSSSTSCGWVGLDRVRRV